MQQPSLSTTQDAETAEPAAIEIRPDDAEAAANFLKTMAHRDRLSILCALSGEEKSVSELESNLELRQSSVSQHLARLRMEGFVTARRRGKQIFYSISDERTLRIIGVLHDLFCAK